jgi:dCMP deaminase
MDGFEQKLFNLAASVSEWSQSRKAKVGAVIYDPATMRPLVSNYNELTRGMDYSVESHHNKPMKGYVWEHAERNAIFLAARNGVATEGKGMAVNWYPCADCARAIVQSGISHLIVEQPDLTDASWAEDFNAAAVILDAARLNITVLPPTRWTPTASSPVLSVSKRGGILIDFPGADHKLLEPIDTMLGPVS